MPRDFPVDIPTTVRVARNLKHGDVVELNWYHEFRIKNRDMTNDAIDYMGELRNQNDEWRVLSVDTSTLSPPVMTTPGRTDPIIITDIKPIGGTLLSAELAWEYMETNVSVDHAYRARRIEVSRETSQKIGECPVCNEDMLLDAGKGIVGCLECGVWIESEIYEYWSERSQNVECDPDAYADDSNAGNNDSLEHWVQD